MRAPGLSALRDGLRSVRDGHRALQTLAISNNDSAALLDKFKTGDRNLIDVIRFAHQHMPPTVMDAMLLLLWSPEATTPSLEDFEAGKYPMEQLLLLLAQRSGAFDQHLVPLFGMMLAMAAVAFDAAGTPIVWNQESQKNALWAVHRIITGGDSQSTAAVDAESLLGTTIVQTYLPIVHDLPIDDLLAFRSKHEGELEAFRCAVGELATSIDITKSPGDIQRQARDVVRNKVNPAVRDLNAKLRIARLDALQKVGKSWESVASLTFSSAIAVLAGAPLNVSALSGLVGAVGQALIDGAFEKRKIMHASQWAALVRFNELK